MKFGWLPEIVGFPPSSWTGQAQRLDGPDLSDEYIRAAGIEIASRCTGPIDRPVIYDAMYPWDPEWAQRDMAQGQDHCALFALMVLRAMGIELPDDGIPEASRFGSAPLPPGRRPILDPVSRMRQLSGWVAGNDLPPRGCALMIGRVSEPRSTHVLWVDHYEGDQVFSFDGGRGDIHQATRFVRRLGREVCLYDATMGNRAVLGHVDPARMRSAVVREYCLPR